MNRHATVVPSLLVAVTVPVAIAQEPFRTSRHVVLPPTPANFNVCAGDVDGDGDVDLVIANLHAPNQLLFNDGRGRFSDATAGRLTTPSPPIGHGNATYAVDLADIDGDGDLDLLLCNDHELPNRVHVNNGAGVFTDVSATALPPNNAWSHDQVVADLDGDGDVDWLVQNSGPPQLYLNDGSGVFTDVTSTNLPASAGGATNTMTGCMAADLDQDGDLDVVLPDTNALPTILINQGAAVFTLAPRGLALFAGPAYACDLDGDGRDDLVVGSGRFLLRNLGNLTFAAPMPLPGPSVDAIDYDEDGDLDPFYVNFVYRNDGAAGFTALPASGVWPYHPVTHCTADFDGDRDIDIARGNGIGVNFLRQLHAPLWPTPGQNYTVEYYCPPDSPIVLLLNAVGTRAATIPVPGFGILRLDPSRSQMLPTLFVTGGFGRLAWTIPDVPGLVGFELDYQSLVVDPLRPATLGNAMQDFVR